VRAHFTRPVTDDQGNLLPNAQISVFNPGTTDLITPVLYKDVDVLAAGSDSPHTGTGLNSLVIGVAANAVGDTSTALGPSASSGGVSSVALGAATNALGDSSAALGTGASASGVGSTAVGRAATSGGDSSLALGDGAQTSDASAVALGAGAVSAFANAAAIGPGAQTTQANQVLLGATGSVVEIAEGVPVVLTDANGVRWTLVVDTDGSLDTELA
jgi:autotransporter adhesin